MVSIIMNTSQQIINSGKETKQKKKSRQDTDIQEG